ncbi:MAG: hypothetical protein QOI80_172, partial [Solirubrobacteraceae bacterium]|nr:hypothetical protein [Solirubrobacteraceae bacterium]
GAPAAFAAGAAPCRAAGVPANRAEDGLTAAALALHAAGAAMTARRRRRR